MNPVFERLKRNIIPPIILLILLFLIFVLIVNSINKIKNEQCKNDLIKNTLLIHEIIILNAQNYIEFNDSSIIGLIQKALPQSIVNEFNVNLSPSKSGSQEAIYTNMNNRLSYQLPINLNSKSYLLNVSIINTKNLSGGFVYFFIFTLLLIIAHGVGMLAMNMRLSKLDETEKALFQSNDELQAMNVKLSLSNDQLKKTVKKLKKSKIKAEESNRLKSAFLANISHEIRTPMNGIMGFTLLLKRPELNIETQLKYIKIIEESGLRLLNIINDLIDISKLESGQMPISNSSFYLNELIEKLYDFFRPEAETKGIKINHSELTRMKISSDQEKIYSVLTNLIKNALKYSEKGTIEIGYVNKGNFVELFVKDTGIGIPPNAQKTIFERFSRGSQSFNNKYEGAGLGLAISKAYVELMGGMIWVESREAHGSTFWFSIPI